MEKAKIVGFQALTDKVGRFSLRDKICLIPEMNRIGSHLLAAVFRGFGINARVMETYKGLDLGREYTSGKECYPCQITMGDILYCMKEEAARLGDDFHAEDYIYFMPEADGPCRFGMYNKYQRIVLDSFPELDRLKIGSLSTQDGYSLAGIIEDGRVRDLRKASYFSLVIGDILDRLLWRIRPYEKEAGSTDEFIETSMRLMEELLERMGPQKEFDKVLDRLEQVIEEGKGLIDPAQPARPLIGMVGEIYLRTHVHANQDLIRVLEGFGAEVVNASLAEWVNYISYDALRSARRGFLLALRRFRTQAMKKYLKDMMGYGGDLYYQEFRLKRTYARIRSLIDLPADHRVAHLEKILKEEDLLDFDVGTEACLSIPGIIEYAREGYNGVVNVYPFTCMPSTITSAIVGPLMNRLGIPYLDTPYDSTSQPGREAAIRTFMYQAEQHFKRHGRKGNAETG
ncbi:MAG: CoA activase [Deltaproteobacteria bacterium]|nr:CoA activase [Deltaproteobacteria bacterium]MBW2047247.1 CoA activase [Deltaproteobacteria bacterium]MBW2111808.1 CoA activase [Deltaproteobacteria bacterium]MBW2353979.1 CoA activase [Deltaproteobacteria bacterium]HDZ89677.1 CoA activase [Deltaproteobacteria bacterium]